MCVQEKHTTRWNIAQELMCERKFQMQLVSKRKRKKPKVLAVAKTWRQKIKLALKHKYYAKTQN